MAAIRVVLGFRAGAMVFLSGALVHPVWLGFAGRPWLGEARFGPHDDGSRVSARTLTGVRSVDLDGLTSVGRYLMPRGRVFDGVTDLLVLRDRRGIRLVIEATDTDAAIRRAVERAWSVPGGPTVRVSHFAARRLGLERLERLEPYVPEERGVQKARGAAHLVGLPLFCALLVSLLVGLSA